MRVNGTLVNYYFHCKRQCYLHGNRMNMEDNSEQVKIGKALAKWQLLFYLKVLKDKGIIRKGKLEFVEKGKSSRTM